MYTLSHLAKKYNMYSGSQNDPPHPAYCKRLVGIQLTSMTYATTLGWTTKKNQVHKVGKSGVKVQMGINFSKHEPNHIKFGTKR